MLTAELRIVYDAEDAEASARDTYTWLKELQLQRGATVGLTSTCETGDSYDEVLWVSNGDHVWDQKYEAEPHLDEVRYVHYPTPKMAWAQWRAAFEEYLKDRHGKIHWRLKPVLTGPRTHDPEADKGFLVYARVFVEIDR